PCLSRLLNWVWSLSFLVMRTTKILGPSMPTPPYTLPSLVPLSFYSWLPIRRCLNCYYFQTLPIGKPYGSCLLYCWLIYVWAFITICLYGIKLPIELVMELIFPYLEPY